MCFFRYLLFCPHFPITLVGRGVRKIDQYSLSKCSLTGPMVGVCPGVNILQYSQIAHWGKVYNFLEIREEFSYLLVRVLFGRETLNFMLFLRKRFISKLFLENFCKLCNYTFFQENFLLEKLALGNNFSMT